MNEWQAMNQWRDLMLDFSLIIVGLLIGAGIVTAVPVIAAAFGM